MIIETKYNCGELVWFMNDNKPLEVEISRINVVYNPTKNISYKVGYMAKFIHSTNCESGKWIDEELLFRSKKELLESL